MHNLASLVHKFAQIKVLVVGDAMMDQYHFGRVERLSPEAPVPVFIEESQKGRPGGAANVVANLAALGCQVKSVMPRGPNITIKHRYMVGHHHLFRVDHDVIQQPLAAHIDLAVESAREFDAVVLSDYAKGFLTSLMCQEVIGAARGPVIVDPKGTDWSKYRGATVICPNHKEMPRLIEFDTEICPNILEKRGADGIRLHIASRFCGESEDFPARAKAVFDVTGAGDTVVATVAAVLGAGGRLSDAAILGNLAAGVAVGKIGTAECSAEELLCALASSTDASMVCTPATGSSCASLANIATG